MNKSEIESIFKKILKNQDINIIIKNKQERTLSYILKIELSSPDSPKQIFFLKQYKTNCFFDTEERVRNEYKYSKFFFDILKQKKEFNIINYIYLDPQRYILISEQIKGQELNHFLKFSFFKKIQICKHFFACGQFLNLIHRYFQKKEKYNFLDLEKYLFLRIEKLSNYINFSKQNKANIYSFFDQIVKKYKQKKLLFVANHGDFNIHNIIISNNRIFLLDFCNFKITIPEEDIAYFLAYTLIENIKNFNRHQFGDFKTSFLRGYQKNIEQDLVNLFVLKNLLTFLLRLNITDQHHPLKKLTKKWLCSKILNEIEMICNHKVL